MVYKMSRMIAALTILSLIVFFACRKTDYSSAASKNKAITDPSVSLDIPLAKRFYKLLRTEQGIDVGIAHVPVVNSQLPNTKHPIWQRAVTGETSVAWFVEVPLFYNQRPATFVAPKEGKLDAATRLKLLNASFDRLVIFKNKKTGQVDSRIVTYMPDIDYLNRHGKDISNNGINRMDKDFSGALIYRKWDGNMLFARKMVDGRIAKKFTAVNKLNKVNKPKAGNAREVCDAYCTWSYEQTCYTTISGEFITEECGDWVLVDTYCWEECYDDGSDDGGTGDPCIDYGDCGTPDPPSTPAPFSDFDVNDVNNFNGQKPLNEYADKCGGAQGIWNTSVANNKEVVGLLTTDGKFMSVAMVGTSGGSWGGLYVHDGTTYYTYPDTQGAPTQTYAGMVHAANQYFIPVKATVHTHSPCVNDGTDGISNTTLSSGDQNLAEKYKGIKHYIIGCGAIGSFDDSSDEPSVINTGVLSSTCSSIQ